MGKTVEWEAAPLPALAKLAWPIVVSMLSVSTTTLVDTLFVSQLGTTPVAAVGLGGVAVFALWCFPMGLLRSSKIVVAQVLGGGERGEARAYLAASMLLAVAIGLLVTALGWLLAQLLPLFTATETLGSLAGDYLVIRMLGSSVFLVLTSVQETRQALGDTRSAMMMTLFGNATNIVLDYWFIFGLGTGVVGAAWASNIALCVELLALSSVHARRDGFLPFRPRRKHLRELLRLGIPTGLQFGLEFGSLAVMVAILAAYSQLHAAAHHIVAQIVGFAFLPAVALGEAASVLAGQAVGARKLRLVRRVAKHACGVAMAYAVFCALVMVVGAKWIAAGFTEDAELFALTSNLLLLVAVYQFLDAIDLALRGVLRGTGDVRYVALVGVISVWVFAPIATLTLGYQMGFGAYGAWIGMCLNVLVVTAILARRLLVNGWLESARTARN